MTEAEASFDRVRVIKSSRPFSLRLGELWQYRELLYFLVWRDVKVRYKQTVLGAAWAVIQPVTAMIIFSIIFGRFAKIPSNGLPYPVFVYAGLLAWLYFQQSLTQSSASIVGNAQLVTKVYFPRLVIPLASVASPVVDFGIALTVLLALMAWYGIVPGIELLAAPAFLALALLVAFGIGLWLSALNVRYRDVPYALPFIAQVWLFATPVIYPTSLLPADWRWLLSLNPMTGVIEGFRWSLLGTGKPSVVVVLVSLGSGLALLASGFAYFRTSERQFADVI
jgi:lipopolysaccharide transport system permease protein